MRVCMCVCDVVFWCAFVSNSWKLPPKHIFEHLNNIIPGSVNEPRCEKTGLRGFRPGPTQTGLYNHIR